VQKVLQLIETEKDAFKITSYDVLGTSIEDIFLELMSKEAAYADPQNEKVMREDGSSADGTDSDSPDGLGETALAAPMTLASGRSVSPMKQALTIFRKRVIIARRSWLTPALAVLVAVAGSTIPLVFIRGRAASCVKSFARSVSIPLFLPNSPIVPVIANEASAILNSPPGVINTLGNRTMFLQQRDILDNGTFVQTIKDDYRNLMLGGVSMDLQSGSALVAWEATSPGLTGPTMLNLASNLLYTHAVNASGGTPSIIQANYESFPPIAAGTLFALKWVAFFGAAMVSSLMTMHFHRIINRIFRLSIPLSSLSTYPRNDDHLCKPCSSPMVLLTRLACGLGT
jgi:hypothetical protein